jgi:hypothetical protein
MLIKAGVDISRLRPEIRKKLPAMAMIVWREEKQEIVIASTYEGNHSEGSLHYANLAVDIRRNGRKKMAFVEIQQYLGDNYDVVLKPDHIHIEYDPKNNGWPANKP